VSKHQGPLSDHELIVVLAGYLESQAASSNAARILHNQLGPKLARIIAGEPPGRVLHTKALGRPVTRETRTLQSLIASYIAWRENEGSTQKQAVAEVAQILKLTTDKVLNANRAPSDDALMLATALLENMTGTPAQVLKEAYSKISKAKKTPKKAARGK
jgi:hypothetical protein